MSSILVRKKRSLVSYDYGSCSGSGSDSDSDSDENQVRIIPSSGKCALDLNHTPPGTCWCQKCRYNGRIHTINKYIKRKKPLNSSFDPETVIEELCALGRNVHLTKDNVIVEQKQRKKRKEVRDLQKYTNSILKRTTTLGEYAARSLDCPPPMGE